MDERMDACSLPAKSRFLGFARNDRVRVHEQEASCAGGAGEGTRLYTILFFYYCCCCSCSCWAWKFSAGDGGGARRTIVAGAMSSLAGASARATVTETLSSLSAPPLNTPRVGGTSA